MFYPELKGVALDAYRQMVRELKERAMTELSLSEDEIVVRPLRPEDLGFSAPVWEVAMSANAWTNIVSTYQVADNRFIGINGVYNNEGAGELVALEINRAGTDARKWNIIPIRSWRNRTGYADDPVTVDQNITVTIKGYATTASTITDWALIGVVVEKKGMTISP